MKHFENAIMAAASARALPKPLSAMGAVLLLSLLPFAGALAADVDNGADVFDAHCAECHSISSTPRNKKGPSLYGVVGRHAGSVAGFNYSAANRAAAISWTPEVLRHYLAGPQAAIPGTTMKFRGLANPKEIDDLVAFLEHPE